jgi:hypothetical protein
MLNCPQLSQGWAKKELMKSLQTNRHARLLINPGKGFDGLRLVDCPVNPPATEAPWKLAADIFELFDSCVFYENITTDERSDDISVSFLGLKELGEPCRRLALIQNSSFSLDEIKAQIRGWYEYTVRTLNISPDQRVEAYLMSHSEYEIVMVKDKSGLNSYRQNASPEDASSLLHQFQSQWSQILYAHHRRKEMMGIEWAIGIAPVTEGSGKMDFFGSNVYDIHRQAQEAGLAWSLPRLMSV